MSMVSVCLKIFVTGNCDMDMKTSILKLLNLLKPYVNIENQAEILSIKCTVLEHIVTV